MTPTPPQQETSSSKLAASPSEVFVDLESLPEVVPMAGLRAKVVQSEEMTLAYWRIDAGAQLPEHQHPQEQVATVIEGEFELSVAGERRLMGPGQVAVIPSNAPHSGRALTACRIVDVWHPRREDLG